jgi:hypothetical protein
VFDFLRKILFTNYKEIIENQRIQDIVSSGLKTGMYYLRTRAAVNAIQFTVDQTKLKELRKQKQGPKPEEKVTCDEQTDKQTDDKLPDNDSNKLVQIRGIPENYVLPPHAARFPTNQHAHQNRPKFNNQHVENNQFSSDDQQQLLHSQQFVQNHQNVVQNNQQVSNNQQLYSAQHYNTNVNNVNPIINNISQNVNNVNANVNNISLSNHNPQLQ